MAFLDARQAQIMWLDPSRNPAGGDSRYRTINALAAAAKANTSIQVSDLGNNTGKSRDVKVMYFPADCTTGGDCTDNICTDGVKIEPSFVNYTLGECTASRVYSLGLDDLRNIDGNFSFSDTAQRMLRSAMDNVRMNFDKALAANLVASVGTFPDGSTSKLVSLTDPTTGAIRPYGYFEVERAIQDAGLTLPFVVGGAEVFTWEKGLAIGGINAQGQRIDVIGRNNVFYDKEIETAFADPTNGHLIAFSAEALKLITFSHYAGMFANDSFNRDVLDRMFRAGNEFLYTAIPDNATGLVYDLKVIFDKCTDTWNMQVKINWDLFKMPANALCNGAGVTGVFHFETCLPLPVECPTVTP